LPRQAHQQGIDLMLGQGVVVFLFADIDAFGIGACKVEYAFSHQMIEHHRIGAVQ
jgi:hypothetical protein